jgi:RNA polymerase sigma factor (sigma-70 family)
MEEERKLLLDYHDGGVESFSRLINSHLRFVIFLLKDYVIPSTVDVMDVIQEGNLGLICGIKKFDPIKFNTRLSTYCAFWIKFFISKTLTSQSALASLFTPIPDNEEELEVKKEEVSIAQNVALDIVSTVFSSLNPREKFILTYLYGLEPPYQPKTLEEIGSMLHLSFERVRQLKECALRKINKEEILKIIND